LGHDKRRAEKWSERTPARHTGESKSCRSMCPKQGTAGQWTQWILSRYLPHFLHAGDGLDSHWNRAPTDDTLAARVDDVLYANRGCAARNAPR
jgi:hypothetical protein